MVEKKPVEAGFDVEALVSALETERESRGLTWKEVAAESGVSASTLTRLTQGRRPDVDSLAALTAWMSVPADSFMRYQRTSFGAAAPLTQISAILRQDPNLNMEGIAALEEMIKSTYRRLKKAK